MSESEYYLIYEASSEEFRQAMDSRDRYLESLRNDLRARGVHPSQAEFILEDAKIAYLKGYQINERGNDQLDDDRDRVNRFIGGLRRY